MNSFNIHHQKPFPIDALPTVIKNAVTEVQANTQAPLALVASSALGAISLACQNSINVCRPNGIESPVSLFLLTIAESGERKTTVDNLFMKPIFEFEEVQAKKSKLELLEYKAKRLAWDTVQKAILAAVGKKSKKNESIDHLRERLAAHLAEEPKKPRIVKLIYNDATPEALKFGLREHFPSAGIMSDEAGSIFDGRAFNDFGVINTLWGGGTLKVDRRSSESFSVEDGRLSISLMVQYQVLKKFIDKRGEEARGIGFLARFLIAYPYSTQGTRYIQNQAPSWQHLPIYSARFAEILNANLQSNSQGLTEKRVITFSREAQTRWIDAYNSIESFIPSGEYLSDIKDYAAKIAENVARMAALFHFFEGGKGEISFDTVDRAAEVCYWYTEEFKRLFASPPEIPVEQADANLLESWLRNYARKYGFEIRKNDIRRLGPNPLRNKARLDAALYFLSCHDLVRFGTVHKTSIVYLNSNHFASW